MSICYICINHNYYRLHSFVFGLQWNFIVALFANIVIDCVPQRNGNCICIDLAAGYTGKRRGPIPAWTECEVDQASVMGTTKDTAQVRHYLGVLYYSDLVSKKEYP